MLSTAASDSIGQTASALPVENSVDLQVCSSGSKSVISVLFQFSKNSPLISRRLIHYQECIDCPQYDSTCLLLDMPPKRPCAPGIATDRPSD
jgi:hypothetical protein